MAAAHGQQKCQRPCPCPLGQTPLTHTGVTKSDSVGTALRAGSTLGTDLLSLREPQALSPCWNKGGFSDGGWRPVCTTLCVFAHEMGGDPGLGGDAGVTDTVILHEEIPSQEESESSRLQAPRKPDGATDVLCVRGLVVFVADRERTHVLHGADFREDAPPEFLLDSAQNP